MRTYLCVLQEDLDACSLSEKQEKHEPTFVQNRLMMWTRGSESRGLNSEADGTLEPLLTVPRDCRGTRSAPSDTANMKNALFPSRTDPV